jgi:hypothetical protein
MDKHNNGGWSLLYPPTQMCADKTKKSINAIAKYVVKNALTLNKTVLNTQLSHI